MSAKYIDLLICNDDLTPDAGGIPEKIADRASIAQDLVHMIRESGLLTEMLANRDAGARRLNMIKVTLAMDDDERIVPGTAEITETKLGTYLLTAETVDYGPILASFEV
ncbi:DUF2590 family protein [Bilophila wadsworthia]|uniref:DUF2590 family protein n=1 Tax=Bilophila wadsworthia TaxID=35833 RepID=UPI0039F641A9